MLSIPYVGLHYLLPPHISPQHNTNGGATKRKRRSEEEERKELSVEERWTERKEADLRVAAALTSAAVAIVAEAGSSPWQPHLLAINHLPGSDCMLHLPTAGHRARSTASTSGINPMPGGDFLFASGTDISLKYRADGM